MVRKLPDSKIQEMFAAFKKKQTVTHVSEKCGVHHLTAKKYIEKLGWRERIQKIEQTVQERDDEREVEQRLDNLEVVRLAIKQMYEAIQNKEMHWSPSDLERIIRLEADLLGTGNRAGNDVKIEIYNTLVDFDKRKDLRDDIISLTNQNDKDKK